ncbi:hypothetical protein, partial [Gallibacterium anatis]|uniref:hypothetical protein n=1 Tax=Gallibacterium anatis TaxID=750 RepID=UPI003005ED23
SVGNSLISLDNEGTLCIQSDEVRIDGEKVFLNRHSVSPFATTANQETALAATLSEDSDPPNTNSEEMEDAILAAYLSNEVY